MGLSGFMNLFMECVSSDAVQASEAEAFRVISEFRHYDQDVGPEGLSLAEEFLLLWDDKEDGEMKFTSAWMLKNRCRTLMFAVAILLRLVAQRKIALRSRNVGELAHTESIDIRVLDHRPTGDACADAILAQLAGYGEVCNFRSWLKVWSIQLGTPSTFLNLALTNMANKGLVRFTGKRWPVSKPDVRTRLQARLKAVAQGKIAPDAHSVVQLAMCSGADYAGGTWHGLLRRVLGKHIAKAERQAVDRLVFDSALKEQWRREAACDGRPIEH